jgi:SAM-dependent methyltransferase
MHKEYCSVCQNELSVFCVPWSLHCTHCGYEKSNLLPQINSQCAHELINEDSREIGLKKLRSHNFYKIMETINSLKPNGGRLLEVGCAHGWFLEIARNHFEVFGLEPDNNFYIAACQRNLPVRMGYFPDAIKESEKFDVIVFNDVIEHIKDINKIILFCHQCLNKTGLLVLNLPSSNGLFYKLSKMLGRVGIMSLFERLWQKDLPSPHLHYFNPHNLTCLLRKNKFEIRKQGSLASIALSGLYTRISYTGNLNIMVRLFIYMTVAMFIPIMKLLPKDIMYIVASPIKSNN